MPRKFGETLAAGRVEPAKRVGYAYDVRMKHHFDLEDHDDPHPEDPRRIYWIYDILERAGCLKLMRSVSVRPVTDTQILRVHSRSYLEKLKQTELMEKSTLLEAQEEYESVTLCTASHYCARLSAGGLLGLCTEVVKGQLDSGLAIIRPPGHHACQNRAMGFCLLNNVAIAIRELQTHGLVDRVLVVDWDVHHGNGIQEAFYSDDSVLYFSLHRFEGGDFFPTGGAGDMDKVGKDRGRGFNINVPWAADGVGDGDYMYAFKRLLLPVAREYMPDLIVVACGFDAATCDPIGMCNVSPECYGAMTAMLRGVCSKVVLSLEGGYNLDAIANSALGCVKALLGIRWSAGLVPQAASFNAYATLSEAEINGVQTGKLVYEAGWLALPKWDPAVEVPECVRAQPSELGKQVVDRVAGEVGRYWQSL